MRNLTLLALMTMGLALPTATPAQPLQAIARPPKSIPVWRCVVDTDGDGVCDLRDNCPDWPTRADPADPSVDPTRGARDVAELDR